MRHETACGIRKVFNKLDWSSFPQKVGDNLLKNPRALANLLSQIMNGEVSFSPDNREGNNTKKDEEVR